MDIKKIEKKSKAIKEYLNNIDAIGIYYNFITKNIEILLDFKRFYKLFKNYLKNVCLEFNEGEKHFSKRITKLKNSFYSICLHYDKIDFYLIYKIGKIKYSTCLNSVEDIKKIGRVIKNV